MVVRETKMMSGREVESSTRHNGGAGAGGGENHPFTSLGRQSSIYSLTLDEFQHALCENGKNFGSMNMDEFLVSIWNAEENNNNNHQAAASHPVHRIIMVSTMVEVRVESLVVVVLQVTKGIIKGKG
ncbi:unnamed protein product [Brassica napus]|nr:unnamed protein product [Brassica napus]